MNNLQNINIDLCFWLAREYINKEFTFGSSKTDLALDRFHMKSLE